MPRDGARELRGSAHRRADERALRQHQGRPRGAARPRHDLPARARHAGRAGRLAADHVPHARRRAVLGRHLFPADAALRPAGLRRRCCEGIADVWREPAREGAPRTSPPSADALDKVWESHGADGISIAVLDQAAQRSSPRTSTRCMAASAARPNSPTPPSWSWSGAPARRLGEPALGGEGGPHARPHVPGRHLRPSRRRLRALFHRRGVARAAFREDALRQRAAHRPAADGVAGHAERAVRDTAARDGGVGAARDGGRGRRVRRHARRRFGRPRGQVLRLDGGGDRRPARRRRTSVPPRLRRHGWRQLGRREHPQPLAGRRFHRRGRGGARALPRHLVRGAVEAHLARLGRQGAGRLERADDRGAGARRARDGRARLDRRRAPRLRLRHQRDVGGRPDAATAIAPARRATRQRSTTTPG